MTRKPNRPEIEALEDRSVPAVVSSQVSNLTAPKLTAADVEKLLGRAAAATASNDAIIAVVDRSGNLLGVLTEGGVSPAIFADMNTKVFAIDGAIAKARTAAFFANDTAPLTSRTIQDISQTTMTEREINSNPNVDNANPNSTARGPGFVAPIGIKGHFPPGVAFTPQVDLFAIEHTNRDSILHPGADGLKGTADDVVLMSRFNVNPVYIGPGKLMNPPLSYGEYILSAADRLNPAFNHYQSRGIATLPGGIPIYKNGALVGGIGVFFPGTTGFASEENSSLNGAPFFDPTKPDRSVEAEFIALAAAGGSRAAGFPVGALGGIPKPAGFDIPDGRIDLAGITLDVIGPGGDRGPFNLVSFAVAHYGVGGGTFVGATFQPIDSTGAPFVVAAPTLPPLADLGPGVLNVGITPPSGYLVKPHAGVGISAADVRRIIQQGIAEAQRVRAQIRLPDDERTRMVFAVADSTGEILGLYRMADSTIFSIDVAVAKARNEAYYNSFNLQPQDQVLPKGIAFTNRTFRYLAHPRFPISVHDAPPGPFSILNDGGVNTLTGGNVGAPLQVSSYQSVQGYDAFHPGTNFRATAAGILPQNQNGIVFFPGSSGVYKHGKLRGGFGVSGDGVDQDDMVTYFGIAGYTPPAKIRVDHFFVRDVRLPYLKFPRNPER